MNNLNTFELQKKLSGVALPSGFLEPQTMVISDLAKSMGYTCDYDALGSLYCRKGAAEAEEGSVTAGKAAGEDCTAGGIAAGGLMLAAAMDTKGFLVTHVKENRIRFNTIGDFEAKKLVDAAVRFEKNLYGRIRTNNAEEPKLSDLYIELEYAVDEVETGDAAVLCGPVRETEKGQIQAVHADHLAACVTLLKTMEALQDDPVAEKVTFVFLGQYWSGRMGVRAAVNKVQPHTCILCGTSESLAEGGEEKTEYPVDIELGKGPVIRFRESMQASDEATCRQLVAAAEAAGIPWQAEARNYELAGGIEVIASGARPGQSYLGIPMKGRGTTQAKYCQSDVDDAARVLTEFVWRNRL